MGSADERGELGGWLAAAWQEARGADAARQEAGERAPDGWRVETGDDGREILVGEVKGRRIGALVLAALPAGLVIAAISMVGAGDGPGHWTGAAVLALMAVAASAGLAWLVAGRTELRPVPGSLRRVRRFMGREWVKELSAARLTLGMALDSDGDERWTLVASGNEGKFDVASDLHSPGAARHMGLWLARRMDVELEGEPVPPEVTVRRAG
jgi:hypothetical protein